MNTERRDPEMPAGFELVQPKRILADDEITISMHSVYLSRDIFDHLGRPKHVHIGSRTIDGGTVYAICPAPSADMMSRRIAQRNVSLQVYDRWPHKHRTVRLTTSRDDTPAVYFVIEEA